MSPREATNTPVERPRINPREASEPRHWRSENARNERPAGAAGAFPPGRALIPARWTEHSRPVAVAGIEAISSPSGYQTEAFASPGASFATTLTSAQFTVLLDGTSRSVCAGSWCPMAEHSSGGGFSDVSFLTVAEVAAAMRVSKMTVYRLVHAGELPAVRVGRSFRVSEDAVDEYLRRSFFQAG